MLAPIISAICSHSSPTPFVAMSYLRTWYIVVDDQIFNTVVKSPVPGRVAQSVTCLATDACLTADPGVASSIPARTILSWRLIMK